RPAELRCDLIELRCVECWDGAGFEDYAFGVARGRLHAQADRRLVALVGVQLQLPELGGRAEAQRKYASGERVERARVARLFGAQEPLGLLQRLVAGKTQWLVEEEHPV